MEKYVRPEMEIDFVEGCEILTTSFVGCTVPDSLADGSGEDPFDN